MTYLIFALLLVIDPIAGVAESCFAGSQKVVGNKDLLNVSNVDELKTWQFVNDMKLAAITGCYNRVNTLTSLQFTLGHSKRAPSLYLE